MRQLQSAKPRVQQRLSNGKPCIVLPLALTRKGSAEAQGLSAVPLVSTSPPLGRAAGKSGAAWAVGQGSAQGPSVHLYSTDKLWIHCQTWRGVPVLMPKWGPCARLS